ncbi:hypothetical protein, partial [Aeromonas caviae]|uniref:hypothetical protein n=1 Tax=Aeromonas caviae TaxID=648 RepID=UPI004039A598
QILGDGFAGRLVEVLADGINAADQCRCGIFPGQIDHATGKSFWALEAAMSIACSVAGGDVVNLKPQHTGRVV